MAHDSRRSRSNTSMSVKSNRPLSRASTASLHSFDQHDQPSHGLALPYQQQPSQLSTNYTPQQYDANYSPLQTALLQAAQHASQQEGLPVDSVHQLMAYPGEPTQNPSASLPHPGFDQNHAAPSFQINHGQQQFVHAQSEEPEKKKKSSASGSATNDKELREMLVRNDGRALKDVAAEVIATDRTPKAEKSKQLFAMLWLKSACKTAKTSVPRNRVYSKYAERCGTDRVIPLNPASFGKLVRVIFPGIQTRRLGVRGESKYHYVELALIDDADGIEDGRRSASGNSNHQGAKWRQPSIGPKLDFNASRVPADTAAFPPQDQTFESQNNYPSQGPSKGRLFTNIYAPDFRPATTQQTSSSYEYELKFLHPEQYNTNDDMDIALPDISPYLPPRTDADVADALVALYRTHCTSLIDSIRYCKEKQFFRLFTSFHGTLTVPVQKLFALPEIAPWIRECDWMMYQKMIRSVSQLTLQVAPPQVCRFLDNVAKLLHQHLSKVFHALPLHTLESKLEPATLFAHLVRQMLRVNGAAHAAAVMLSVDENREQMWSDWQRHVNVKQIMENELPLGCAHEEVYTILSNEIRGLLLPLKSDAWVTHENYLQEQSATTADISSETVIDRIASFLTKIPIRFPQVPARTLLYCINALGSAALREITIERGMSFHAWWIAKVFVDELGQWLASLGGFLDHKPPNWNALTYSPGLLADSMNVTMANGGSGSNNDSRYSSVDADFAATQSFTTINGGQQGAADHTGAEIAAGRFHQQYESMTFGVDLDLTASQQEPNHDDSGIALLEDGLDAKFAQTVRSHLTQLPAGVS
ncbi:hypothetical protein P154DRAFT_339090 [Amniculicola lignicola CBS 123094]|uniref:RFX-type winged-helix domain-containing protein n=1 Tax=Amniculicola lignicola CBS 123094 TaxID=1392246 RepID=A0A6A5WWH3_9PLEO|nr:hypothetical protein P154DRAFT_339090 [Amniculicola lignicola CBS 123094]